MSLLSELLATVQESPTMKLRTAAAELQKELKSDTGSPNASPPRGPEILAAQAVPFDYDNGYRWLTLEVGRADEVRIVLWQHKTPLFHNDSRPVSTLADMHLLNDADVQDVLRTYVRLLNERGGLRAA